MKQNNQLFIQHVGARIFQGKAPYILCVAIGSLWVLAVVFFFASTSFSITNDGSGYIEVAENISAGHGIRATPWGLLPPESTLVPPGNQPFGYPVLIALVSSFGADPATAAVWITRSAWALFPVAVLFAMSPLLGAVPALVVALLAMTTPALVEYGFVTAADPPFVLGSVDLWRQEVKDGMKAR